MSLSAKKEDQLDAGAAVMLHERFLRSQVQRWISKLPHLKMHEDDLMQEGRLGLAWAAAHFDVSRGVSFLSFAGKAVHNLVRNFVARLSHLIRFPEGRPVSFVWMDAPLEEGERPLAESLPLPEQEVWEADDRHVRLIAALRGLKQAEQYVITQCVMGGRLQRSVAAEMGCSHTWVQQLVDQGLRRLRLAMGVPVAMQQAKRLPMAVPAGCVPLKVWLAREAAGLGLSPGALYARISRGRYPMPVRLTVNGRHFVQTEVSTLNP
jgi:RNA polymerase sigma factor (sigma-70 family)